MKASALSFDSNPFTVPSLRKYRSALPSLCSSPSYERTKASSSAVGRNRIIDWTDSASRTSSSIVCTAAAMSSSEALICESMISMLLPRFKSRSVTNAFLPLPAVMPEGFAGSLLRSGLRFGSWLKRPFRESRSILSSSSATSFRFSKTVPRMRIIGITSQ